MLLLWDQEVGAGADLLVLRSMGRRVQGKQKIHEELVEKELLWLVIFDQEL